ncbi:hypothetical protein L2E82_16635 [Cichorium intybus]|uniref:Uncharacterized protein n=1 Tax=Cichorium intybus TaxID=13427 RepID=A0ACB9F7B3_CICIN|nr:hypothetical protein L2E82_16635 [Cichorium intybus]
MEPVVVLDMAAEGVADGIMEGRLSEGGTTYGRPDLPCELESGTLGPNESVGRVAGETKVIIIFDAAETVKEQFYVAVDNVVGLDLVDDESKLERCPTKHMPTPSQWIYIVMYQRRFMQGSVEVAKRGQIPLRDGEYDAMESVIDALRGQMEVVVAKVDMLRTRTA